MTAKRYRLWINSHGKPLYVELDGMDLGPDEMDIIRRQIDELDFAKTVILSPEWELRVLA